jgi:hypothetical protein
MPSKVNLNRFQRFAGEQYSDCDHSHPIRRGLQFCADAVQCLEFYDSVDLNLLIAIRKFDVLVTDVYLGIQRILIPLILSWLGPVSKMFEGKHPN